MIDSQFFRDQARKCRVFQAEAVRWTVREGLANMAAEFEQIAAELERQERPADGMQVEQDAKGQ